MIDWARVEELREEIVADDFDEAVELFYVRSKNVSNSSAVIKH